MGCSLIKSPYMFVVPVKSTASDFLLVCRFGDCVGEVMTIPPGPLGTLRKDLPRKSTVVGIPVIQEVVRSSSAVAEPSPLP